MPEIAEVARIVHYIRKLLVGKTIAKVTATDDSSVYGKAGTSAAEFEKHMAGKKIVDAGQQGKYFWMTMSSAPHPVMHFGMSGWLKFKSEHTYYYQPQEGKKDEIWPPKFMKFMLKMKPEDGEEAIEAAFVDMRRFGRIRLVDCPGAEIRQHSPLVENGPDPVIDKNIVTVKWLKEKCKSKKVPIKAMLLDQANISGIGNWVGDEIMYNAKIHPEQYANTLNDEQIEQLHKSIHYICSTSVELLADSEKFPDDWLFRHRWGKGKKGASNTLPNGEKIAFLTVGGRTSAVVPSVQKKTGPVAKEVSEAEVPDGEEEDPPKNAKGKKRKAAKEDEEEEGKPKESKGKKRKSTVKEEDEDEDEEEVMPKKTTARGKKVQTGEEAKPMVNGDAKPMSEAKKPGNEPAKKVEEKSVKTGTTLAAQRKAGKSSAQPLASDDTGRRRSGRLSKS
ncbi:formamidopyrimidine-DNA glycosylase [Cladophialophora bantiana CBS 173.52]|uniref:Formamidopyrimidine-DNA glycosylase n=1 Tax=Cladophialophora bantiana (strain ATCC 10958 / CBS 173.52 / CDC B-1940 / NIH 8579) TaxID=1442370 RepID=A0A0D2HCV8_CLAB1|nr:formamidopyrimidine-DNA glycosylase [Cladophialophora bantiana CBS 173.52]KIW91108.1 formamidopyrimidine-DNA glycosylase [Cladophialophora bantiana CBS 173.52]